VLDPREAVDRLRAAFGGPDGYRTLHAKGRFYAGSFTATPEAAALCRAGHLDGSPRPVLVRWSTASGNGRAKDPSPDIRGMAVKFAGDDGQPFDLLGQTSTSFPTQDPEEFVRIAEASRNQLTFPLFLLRHPQLIPAFLRGISGVKSHHSFAETAFYPLHAYGWLDAEGRRTWVRHEFRPTATREDRLAETFTGRDRLAEEIAARLVAGPVVHEVWVQLAEERHDPDDVTTAWKGARTLLAGRIEVTAEADDPEAGGSPTVFDPSRTVDGIELPNDPILLYRRGAYSESVSRRTR
jgi:catalase